MSRELGHGFALELSRRRTLALLDLAEPTERDAAGLRIGRQHENNLAPIVGDAQLRRPLASVGNAFPW